MAKLNWDLVAQIRSLSGIESCYKTAVRFGVGASTIKRVRSNSTWRLSTRRQLPAPTEKIEPGREVVTPELPLGR